jgi:hypothetical protein
MVRISFPLAVPGILSAGIFAFTLSWNEFLYVLVFRSRLSLLLRRALRHGAHRRREGLARGRGAALGGSIVALREKESADTLKSRSIALSRACGAEMAESWSPIWRRRPALSAERTRMCV